MRCSSASFKVPVNHRESGEIVGGVRNHRHKDPASASKDCAEDQPGDGGLFYAGKSLIEVVAQPKPSGRDQHNSDFRADARREKLAEAFEHVSAKERLFFQPAARQAHMATGSIARFPAQEW